MNVARIDVSEFGIEVTRLGIGGMGGRTVGHARTRSLRVFVNPPGRTVDDSSTRVRHTTARAAAGVRDVKLYRLRHAARAIAAVNAAFSVTT